jgi:hypothetical protein
MRHRISQAINIQKVFFPRTMSSAVSISESTRLDELPESKPVLGEQFKKAHDDLSQANKVTDELCKLCNDIDTRIRSKAEFTSKRIEYLSQVNDASKKFWSIVGTTVGILIALKGIQIVWNAREWFKRQKEAKVPIPDADEGKSSHVKRRLHPRDWMVEK